MQAEDIPRDPDYAEEMIQAEKGNEEGEGESEEEEGSGGGSAGSSEKEGDADDEGTGIYADHCIIVAMRPYYARIHVSIRIIPAMHI